MSGELFRDARDSASGVKDSKGSLLDLGVRMLAVVCGQVRPEAEILAVGQPFAVPLVDQERGEILDRDLVGSVDLLERDAEGLVVVDLKTAARKYSDLQVEASLQGLPVSEAVLGVVMSREGSLLWMMAAAQ